MCGCSWSMQFRKVLSWRWVLSHRVCWVVRTCHIPFRQGCKSPICPRYTLLHCDNPTLYQFVQTECYWCSTTTAVELFSVYSPPCVVCGNDTVGRRVPTVVLSLADDLVIDSFRERLHYFFLCFCFQPIFVGLYVFFLIHLPTYNTQ